MYCGCVLPPILHCIFILIIRSGLLGVVCGYVGGFFCRVIVEDHSEMKIYTSSTLSVSQQAPLDCLEMARHLSRAGIVTSITSNVSTQPQIEYGCRLTQSISTTEDIRKIWKTLQKHYPFQCGHLSVGNGFDGCILTYLSGQKCTK